MKFVDLVQFTLVKSDRATTLHTKNCVNLYYLAELFVGLKLVVANIQLRIYGIFFESRVNFRDNHKEYGTAMEAKETVND